MRSARTPATPTLAPLRAVSDVLDEVEVDLETFRRDLVLAERAGLVALVVGAVAVAGIVTLVVARGIHRRRSAAVIPEPVWPPVPTAPEPPAPEPPAPEPPAPGASASPTT